ncbi:hypothetical protein CGCSCA4_v005200 [Colletotrichum siamense]|uniref:Uncharacterized protein n=1 Tax=Colletotrichum siamense TaxID=690259 RepID=A0A9P5EWT2_COLSI|nr:hypothetical protein CGCSCA4_v005200 [Colletotrichum siamense]KAF4861116.1 hypothetical protein CGCSCA2_v004662 [Colletotrichum siamense]
MLFTGLLGLLGFGIGSAVLCGEGANRLESVDLSPNAKAAAQIAMIITLSYVFALVTVVPCLSICVPHIWEFFVLLICLEGFGSGAYVVAVTRTNVDKGSCDEYLMSVDTCWSGLRMVKAGGVFRMLLLPLGVIIGTGYWMRFKKERVVTFHGIAHRGRTVARSN